MMSLSSFWMFAGAQWVKCELLRWEIIRKAPVCAWHTVGYKKYQLTTFFSNLACQVLVVACKMCSCGMWDLVSCPGIKPRLPALGGQSLSPWTTGEIPGPRFWSWNQEPSHTLSGLSYLPSFPCFSVLPQGTSLLGSSLACVLSDCSLCPCCYFGLQFTHIPLPVSWIPTASLEPKSVSVFKLPLILPLSMSALMPSELLPNLGFAHSSIIVLTTLW